MPANWKGNPGSAGTRRSGSVHVSRGYHLILKLSCIQRVPSYSETVMVLHMVPEQRAWCLEGA